MKRLTAAALLLRAARHRRACSPPAPARRRSRTTAARNGRSNSRCRRRAAGVPKPRKDRSRSGHIGDIEFYEPNRGALITSGNGGSVKPGVWFYDGAQWIELAEQCGATDGRIAWVGPDEFWTVSDGRAGQAVASSSERPPLEDNTLCHFAPGAPDAEGHQHIEIVGSYGSVPFLGTSYQAMHAAGCLSSTDCWFGGDPLSRTADRRVHAALERRRPRAAALPPRRPSRLGHRLLRRAPLREHAPEQERPRRHQRTVPAAAALDQGRGERRRKPVRIGPARKPSSLLPERVRDRARLPAPQHGRRGAVGGRGRAGPGAAGKPPRSRSHDPAQTLRGRRIPERDRPETGRRTKRCRRRGRSPSRKTC